MSPVAEALKAIGRGWSVIPTKLRSKTPLGGWKERQEVRATPEVELTRFGGHIETWVHHPRKGSSHAEDESTISDRIQI